MMITKARLKSQREYKLRTPLIRDTRFRCYPFLIFRIELCSGFCLSQPRHFIYRLGEGDAASNRAATASAFGVAYSALGAKSSLPFSRPSHGGNTRTAAEALMDLVGEILAKEPLVSRLVAAQALDVLEVEGGGLVFEKLVSLCGGSK